MVRALREELYNRDGHLVLDPYEKFLQTAKAWAGARKAENDAILAAELAAEEAERLAVRFNPILIRFNPIKSD